MAAACSAALHVVGQKCCDDGTARLATFRAKRGLSALSLHPQEKFREWSINPSNTCFHITVPAPRSRVSPR